MTLRYTYFKYVLYTFLALSLSIQSHHLLAQIGLVWANSDYGTEATMSSAAQEITLDIAKTNDYVFSLVGRASALDKEFEQLFIYAHPIAGARVSSDIKKFAISEENSNITFPMKGVTCSNGNSFTPPRKFHLEIHNNNIYIAGTLSGPTGAKFPKATATNAMTIPLVASYTPVLFIARYNLDVVLDPVGNSSIPALSGYNFIYAETSSMRDTSSVAFITDLDIDAATGNPYIVGIYREKSSCDSTVQIEEPIDYTPVLGGTVIKTPVIVDTFNNGGGGLIYTDNLLLLQRPIDSNNNSSNTSPYLPNTDIFSDNIHKRLTSFQLVFAFQTAANRDIIYGSTPNELNFSAGGYNFSYTDLSTSAIPNEINFWAAYTADLSNFYIKPVPILGSDTAISLKNNTSVSGTVLATSMALDDNAVYIGGAFSRPKNKYNLRSDSSFLKSRDYLLYYGSLYCYSGNNCYAQWLTSYNQTDTLLAPAILSGSPRIGVSSRISFAQNSFISKYENNPNARLISEQKISGTATQMLQDLAVYNNQLYAVIQVYKTNAFDKEFDKVYFRTNKDYASSRGYEFQNFYDYGFLTYGADSSNDRTSSIEALGTSIQNGIYLLHVSNSAPLPTKEAKIEKYQKLITSNQTIPYVLSDNLQVDKSGSLFLSMVYSGIISVYQRARNRMDTDPESISTVSALSAAGRSDIAIVKFNSNWEFEWAKSIGGTHSEGMPSIIPDNNGGFYLGGAFQNLTDFEPAPDKIYTLSSRGIHDAFIAKYGCPKVDIEMMNDFACEGTPIELKVDYPCLGGNCNLSYTWTDLATQANYYTVANKHIFQPNVGTNTISVMITDNSTGCMVSDTIYLDALSKLTLTATPPTAHICDGQSIQLSANVNSIANNISYAWYKGTSSIYLDTTTQITATDAGVYRVEAGYRISRTQVVCKAISSVLLNKHEIKTPNVYPDEARLCGNAFELEVKGCPGCYFNWSPPMGATYTSNTERIMADVLGTYVVNVIDNNGCSYLLTKEVVNNTNLLPSIVPYNSRNEYTTSICYNEPLVLEAFPQCPTCTYIWSDGSNSKYAYAITGGDYSVTVSNAGCSGVSNPLHITETALIKPLVNSTPNKICIDNASTSMANLSVNNPCVGCNYTWYTNDKPTNYIVGIGSDLSINMQGEFYVVVRDANNCQESSEVITVDSLPVSLPEITTNHYFLCRKDDVNSSDRYMNTALLETESCNNCSYKWYYQNSNTLQEIAGAILPYYETNTIGAYFVEVTYASGCIRRSEPMVIRAHEGFNISLAKTTGKAKYICDGAPINLSINGSYEIPPNWQYQWFKNDVAIPGAVGYNYTTDEAGYYYLRVQNADGCVAYTQIDTVYTASAGANPILTATPDQICSGESATLTVVTNPCATCTYSWRWDNNAVETETQVPTYRTNNKRGYYVSVYDSLTACVYLSNVVQIREAIVPTPVLETDDDPYCRAIGVGLVLKTTAEVGAEYIWFRTALDSVITTQNSHTVFETSNTYAVKIRRGVCLSPRSNEIPVSFNEYTPQLFADGVPVVCNNSRVRLYVTPKSNTADPLPANSSVVCNGCSYTWYRNGVEIPGVGTSSSIYSAAVPGDYHVVFRDNAGCMTRTSTITVYNSSALSTIHSTTLKGEDTSTIILTDSVTYVCGSTNSTTLSVMSCQGCVYDWYYSPLSYASVNTLGQTTNNIVVTGQASSGYYKVSVNNNGCISIDSIRVQGRVPFRDQIASSPLHNNICNGEPVVLTARGNSIERQWRLDGVNIPGILAQQLSFSATQAGDYTLISKDTFGCIDTTAATRLIASNPAPGFALDFSSINPVAITAPVFNLNNYLQPSSIHGGRGTYTAMTTTVAFSGANNSMFNASRAGAGLHTITYTDTVGSCYFSRSGVIEILQDLNVDIVNRRLTTTLAQECQTQTCPAYEACISDPMTILLTNFPFVPTVVEFNSDNGFIPVTVNPVVNPVGSVISGTIPIVVPVGAKTGKLRIRNGSDIYQTDFFLVVQNPTVDVNLQGVSLPLCSNDNNIPLTAVPYTGATGEGLFSIAYANTPNVMANNLLTSVAPYNPNTAPVSIDATRVIGYDDIDGRRDLILKYSFKPFYTGTTIACANSIEDTMHLEVRNIAITNITYTPISIIQAQESMHNLTLLVEPLNARRYTQHYTGTYVNNDTIKPKTIPTPGLQTVIYNVENSGCIDTISGQIEILPAPTINIANNICKQTTSTIWIGRDMNGPYTQIDNGPRNYFDPQYTYAQDANIGLGYAYTEEKNLMSISLTNYQGGSLVAQSTTVGNERYRFVPSDVIGNETDITITYRYKRSMDYFDVSPSTNHITEYIIGQVTKTIYIESLDSVRINPTIVSDPVFCKVDEQLPLSGMPLGGQFYLDNTPLQNNLFNPNDYNTPNVLNDFQLKYIYTGRACVGEHVMTISIPSPFNIQLNVPGAPDFCREEPNVNVGIVHNLPVGMLDSLAGTFYVGSIASGRLFTPSLKDPGVYPVYYRAYDIYGCEAIDSSIFTVHATPVLSLNTLNNVYCANEPIIPLSLMLNSTDITNNFGNNTVTLTARGIQNSGVNMTTVPSSLTYNANLALNGRVDTTMYDTLTYIVVDAYGCTDTFIKEMLIRELPQLSLQKLGGEPLPNEICEGDTLNIQGIPIGGIFTSINVTPTSASSLVANTGMFIPQILDPNIRTVQEIYSYTFRNTSTNCTNIIYDTITVRNRSEVDILGLPNTICADSILYPLSINLVAGEPIASGTFSATPGWNIIQNNNPNTLTAEFHPEETPIANSPIDVNVRFSYVANACPATKDFVVRVNPLPLLHFTTVGDSLSNRADSLLHICENADFVTLRATNTFNGIQTDIMVYTPPTSSFTGMGIRALSQNNSYIYDASQVAAGISSGLFNTNIDLITYTYTDNRGCTNSVTQKVVIDTFPDLTISGLSPNNIIAPSIYSYCANDPIQQIHPNPTGGIIVFDNISQPFNTFAFQPSLWADSTNVVMKELKYIYPAANYLHAPACRDSITKQIEIRPIPILSLPNLPTSICVGENDGNIILRGLPQGGIFRDTTLDVIGGIIEDSIFNIRASYGMRYITYSYTEPLTNCSNVLGATIPVYRKPNFTITNNSGCVTQAVDFIVSNTGLSNLLPSLDSITTYIWTYGDGLSDTITNIHNAVIVNDTNHIYTNSGIYNPTLTIINQDVCSTTVAMRTVISKIVTVDAENPYYETFDTSSGGWFQETIHPQSAQDSLWHWGIAAGVEVSTVSENNPVWVTRLRQPYRANDKGWVYSPCFDIAALNRPMFAMDTWSQTRDTLDGTVIEYYRPDMDTWVNLGEPNKGINWYNEGALVGFLNQQNATSVIPVGWHGDDATNFQRSSYRLDINTANGDVWAIARPYVRFRVHFAANSQTEPEQRKGFAFDNVFIGDRTKKVLVEYFSNDTEPNMYHKDSSLYELVYDSLYGKDLVLVQYPLVMDNNQLSSQDRNLTTQNTPAINIRQYRYQGVHFVPGSIILNGTNYPYMDNVLNLVHNVDNSLEYLDREMLKQPKYLIKLDPQSLIFRTEPGIRGINVRTDIKVTALDTMLNSLDNKYTLGVAIVEDDATNRQNKLQKSVLRKMLLPINSDGHVEGNGSALPSMLPNQEHILNYEWVFYESDTAYRPYTSAPFNIRNLQLVAFVQKLNSSYLSEVEQVATSRDLTIFYGPVSVDDIKPEQGKEILDLTLYPNPAESYFNVQFSQPLQGNYQWQVVDMLGRIVSTGKTQLGDELIRVSTDEYLSGNYVFTIVNENIQIQRQVVIIKP